MVGALLTIVVPARGNEPARTEVVWFEFEESIDTQEIFDSVRTMDTCTASTRLQ